MSRLRFGLLARLGLGAFAGLLISAPAFAHVVVTPGQANVGQELIFNVSVPNEQTTPVTNVKLDIPAGVTTVVPTAKSSWTITTTQTGTGDSAQTTAITWTGGSIPVGQREDFSFSAQVPDKATDLNWKAYQTYGDGTVVHWDQIPNGSDDSVGDAGPYSVTKVIDDLSAKPVAAKPKSYTNLISMAASLVAVLIACVALFRSSNRQPEQPKGQK